MPLHLRMDSKVFVKGGLRVCADRSECICVFYGCLGLYHVIHIKKYRAILLIKIYHNLIKIRIKYNNEFCIKL
jgi:hypothetical protein